MNMTWFKPLRYVNWIQGKNEKKGELRMKNHCVTQP